MSNSPETESDKNLQPIINRGEYKQRVGEVLATLGTNPTYEAMKMAAAQLERLKYDKKLEPMIVRFQYEDKVDVALDAFYSDYTKNHSALEELAAELKILKNVLISCVEHNIAVPFPANEEPTEGVTTLESRINVFITKLCNATVELMENDTIDQEQKLSIVEHKIQAAFHRVEGMMRESSPWYG